MLRDSFYYYSHVAVIPIAATTLSLFFVHDSKSGESEHFFLAQRAERRLQLFLHDRKRPQYKERCVETNNNYFFSDGK
jgi:hypothetical protein